MSIEASAQALAKLEPYLLLAKSARGAAAAKLVADATAAPGCFVFSELFDFNGIRELENDDKYASTYRLLTLFAYGTMSDYRNAADGTYPPLTGAHIAKLRLLTLASLAASTRNLPYSTLIPSLDFGTAGESSAGNGTAMSASSSSGNSIRPRAMRELEDIIIDAIYAGILSARIDQQRQRVEVESVMGRDVPPGDGVTKIGVALNEWSATTAQVLETLASRIEEAKRKGDERAQAQTEHDAELERVLRTLIQNKGVTSGDTDASVAGARQTYDRMGSDRNGDMELDDESLALRKKKSSSGAPLRSKRSRA